MSPLNRMKHVWVGACGIFVLLASTAFATDFAFVTTTDFSTGSSSVVEYTSPYANTNNVQSVHSDAVARYHGGLIYVVNRSGGDNIQMLDPANSFSTIRQFSVGFDPHDILVISTTKAYVTRYDHTALLIVDPSTGLSTGSIDLSGLADGDGLPEMDQMVRVGDRAFVTIQRLDRNNFFLPVGTSYVAVIDILTDTLIDVAPAVPGAQSIALAVPNPFSEIKFDPYSARLVVASANIFGLQDGGVETIDPATLMSDGVILTEAVAGGDVSDVEIALADRGYVILSDANFNTVLKVFNPQTGQILGTVFSPGGFVLNDAEVSPAGELFVADRTPVLPGIRIFEVGTDQQITTNPIDVGLPPFDIAFCTPVQTGVDEAAPAVAALGQNFPNPFNPTTTIPFSLDRASHVRLSIFDATGRLVTTLIDEYRAAGEHAVTWNGRNGASAPVRSGVYFARLETAELTMTRKLVLLK